MPIAASVSASAANTPKSVAPMRWGMTSSRTCQANVFTLVTGQLLVTIEGEQPVEVTPGQVLNLKGGAKHTFRNTGTVTATIVEVFGKAPKP